MLVVRPSFLTEDNGIAHHFCSRSSLAIPPFVQIKSTCPQSSQSDKTAQMIFHRVVASQRYGRDVTYATRIPSMKIRASKCTRLERLPYLLVAKLISGSVQEWTES